MGSSSSIPLRCCAGTPSTPRFVLSTSSFCTLNERTVLSTCFILASFLVCSCNLPQQRSFTHTCNVLLVLSVFHGSFMVGSTQCQGAPCSP